MARGDIIEIDAARATARRAGIRTGLPRSHIAGACGGALWSRIKRAEPEPNWMPLRQAVFTFGIAEDRRASKLRDKPFSLRELTRTLEEKSGAQEAKIDRAASNFSFEFVRDEGGVQVFFGPPWAYIEEPRETFSTRGSTLRRYSMRRGSSGSVTKKPHVTANDSEQFGTQPA